jgi:hypothetical protein
VRLVIGEERRDIVLEAAMEAAYKENGEREVNYTTEALIKAAVEAAINKLEELLF